MCMPSTSQGHEVGVYIYVPFDVFYFTVLCFECGVSKLNVIFMINKKQREEFMLQYWYPGKVIVLDMLL